MIDFPASPTDGQIFSATNGVVYKWSATYSSWLAQNPAPPLGGGGEVTAASTSPLSLTGSAQQILFPSVQSGNGSGAWSVSTNRYTPPAGKYFLQCSTNNQAPSGGNGTVSISLRKNGAVVNTISGSGSASFNIPVTLGEYVDANGSDFFDWAVVGTSSAQTIGAVFTAFPLTGMQGPTGPAGVNSIPQNAQSGNYTLVAGDAGQHVYHPVAAAAATYTIPANATVPYVIGTTLSFANDSANAVTIAIATDTLVWGTSTGSRTLAQGSMATALKVTTTRWMLNGSGLT